MKLKKMYKGYVAIWVRPKYTELGTRTIVGSYYHPYPETAQEIIDFWIAPEFRHQCYVTIF